MKSSQEIIQVAIGILIQDGKILIARRKLESEFGGLWEFPGGKCQPGENVMICLKREIWEELEIEVSVHEKIQTLQHAYPFGIVQLHAFRCSLMRGIPKAKTSSEIQWVTPKDLSLYPFPPANRPLLTLIGKYEFLKDPPKRSENHTGEFQV